ncbi:VOC family protein [Mycobacterium sp.]|uniref:VOC family protein n=1 Tax=Mycobacterium sp. TaxID=1785 RepID=UPI003D10577E
MALGHLGVNVEDLEAAKTYYGALMPLVGYEQFVDDRDQFAFCPAGGKPGTYLFFYSASEAGAYSRKRVGLQHLAFMVRSRSTVHDVHGLAVRLGCEVLHEPQFFPQYPPPYFATFWLDPCGLMLEAVCHYDRD